jgi:hypothetical protein
LPETLQIATMRDFLATPDKVLILVPGTRLELVHLAAADFESAASTDSAIPAREGPNYLRNKTP